MVGVDDPERFADFVERRQAELARLGWALTGDRHLGEDLAQAALERLWPKWSQVAAHGEPVAYVHRILVTLAVSWRRRRAWTERPVALVPDAPDRAEDLETRQRIQSWLARLPPRQRATVVLRFLFDLSVAETAERLGCNAGTVKSQTTKALANLRAFTDAATEGAD